MAPQGEAGVRIDKWLWAVRVYKTRSLAGRACSAGHVEIDGYPAKPSRKVHIGETVHVDKEERTYIYEVATLLEKRVAAKELPNFIVDHSPAPAEAEPMTLAQKILQREAGTGRPTKKDRRDLDQVFGR